MTAFKFSKFYENKAKRDKRNFKRGFSIAFEVKNVCKITGKIGFKFCKLTFFVDK